MDLVEGEVHGLGRLKVPLDDPAGPPREPRLGLVLDNLSVPSHEHMFAYGSDGCTPASRRRLRGYARTQTKNDRRLPSRSRVANSRVPKSVVVTPSRDTGCSTSAPASSAYRASTSRTSIRQL